jgi:hypothetical protein
VFSVSTFSETPFGAEPESELLVGLTGLVVTTDVGSIISPIINITGVFAAAQINNFGFAGSVQQPRTFFMAGIGQAAVAPGIVMFPTSEDCTIQSSFGEDYAIGSSPNYYVGEVHWNSAKKIQGVDWELVSPFGHIVHIINNGGIVTPITLIYYQWDVGIRAGFQVTSYPIPFAFNGTRIIAERVPLPGKFFTVQYIMTRWGDNPRSIFARYPLIVDELQASHVDYDDISGFQTYRPDGYTVFDLSDNKIWVWNAGIWSVSSTPPDNTKFYVKRDRVIYLLSGGSVNPVFTAGDDLNGSFPEVIGYPLFGEGVGKNVLEDGFSVGASINYPEAYEISVNPGDYDPWI